MIATASPLPPSAPEQLVTTEIVAQHVHLHPFTVRRLVREGRIPAIRIGKRDLRYRLSEVIAALEQGGDSE